MLSRGFVFHDLPIRVIYILDEFTKFGIACVRAKISTGEFSMESLPLVNLIQIQHDITRMCLARPLWQLKCSDPDCIGMSHFEL